jgi:hypothetical protein
MTLDREPGVAALDGIGDQDPFVSTKRVAAVVGKGSMAICLIHHYLAQTLAG